MVAVVLVVRRNEKEENDSRIRKIYEKMLISGDEVKQVEYPKFHPHVIKGPNLTK